MRVYQFRHVGTVLAKRNSDDLNFAFRSVCFALIAKDQEYSGKEFKVNESSLNNRLIISFNLSVKKRFIRTLPPDSVTLGPYVNKYE